MQETTKTVGYAGQVVPPRRRMLGQLAGAAASVPLTGLLLSAGPVQAAADLNATFLGMIQAWNDHDSAKIASFFTENCIYEDVALEVVNRGKKELMAYANATFAAFPDFSLITQSSFAGSDAVGAEWDMIMTWKGPYPGMAGEPTGKTYRLRGSSVAHFKDGKIARNTDYWNLDAFLRQLKS